VLTPVVAHIDKIHNRMGIEVVFTQSIIEYRIHRETCVCCLNTSLSRDSNQGINMSREDSYGYDPMQSKAYDSSVHFRTPLRW
jgi:hypothetical protein